MGNALGLKKYVNVQYLRAAAALMVVFAHAIQSSLMCLESSNRPWLVYSWQLGHVGVGLFFAISGFIMATTFGLDGAHKSQGTAENIAHSINFFVKRIIRIVPLYWIVTIVATVFNSHPVDFASLAKSLLFIPYQNDKLEYFPIYAAGWTLNMELFFYLCFAIQYPIFRGFSCVSMLVTMAAMTTPWFAFTKFYNSLNLFYFCIGIAIALFQSRANIRLRSHTRWVTASVGALVLLTVWGSGSYFTLAHFLLVAVVLFFSTCGSEDPSSRVSRFIYKIGDGSYSLYLLHVFVFVAVERGLKHLLGQQISLIVCAMLLGALISIYLSIQSFEYFEKPTQSWLISKWRAVFGSRGTPRRSA